MDRGLGPLFWRYLTPVTGGAWQPRCRLLFRPWYGPYADRISVLVPVLFTVLGPVLTVLGPVLTQTSFKPSPNIVYLLRPVTPILPALLTLLTLAYGFTLLDFKS